MNKFIAGFFALILSVSLIVSFSNSAVADAGKYVQKLGDRAISTISKEDITEEQLKKEFYVILDKYFDIDAIGRFTLGRHWRAADEKQRKEFLSLFRDMIVNMYSNRFADYGDEKFKVNPNVVTTNRDQIVRSEIIFTGNRPPVKLEWRVRKNSEGQYKIIDLMIEGVSMSITQRNEFDSIVNRNGIDGLLTTMRRNSNRGG